MQIGDMAEINLREKIRNMRINITADFLNKYVGVCKASVYK